MIDSVLITKPDRRNRIWCSVIERKVLFAITLVKVEIFVFGRLYYVETPEGILSSVGVTAATTVCGDFIMRHRGYAHIPLSLSLLRLRVSVRMSGVVRLPVSRGVNYQRWKERKKWRKNIDLLSVCVSVRCSRQRTASSGHACEQYFHSTTFYTIRHSYWLCNTPHYTMANLYAGGSILVYVRLRINCPVKSPRRIRCRVASFAVRRVNWQRDTVGAVRFLWWRMNYYRNGDCITLPGHVIIGG